MSRVPTFLTLASCLVILAACSSSSGASASAAPSPSAAASSPSMAASPSAEASPSPAMASSPSAEASSGPTAVPTSLDPCQMVTAQEASALAGVTFGAGSESTDQNTKICSYGQEGIVLEVLLSVAPDAATAKSQEPAFKAELESGVAQAGIVNPKLTELPNFQDGVDAAVVEGSASVAGKTLGGIALYALKGAVLLAISDVSIGGSVPTSEAMQAQAKVSLARLP
jgi:hypothetical protein